uniref:Putative cell wall protein iff6 n=1 Tax=Anopheles braziliensis TaxID=58242 RepID=A0A2M3Z4F7_9DIPT
MVSDWQKHKIIQEFLIPDELKDDIAYCQKSLRDCVKVHQYLTERCKDLQEEQKTLVKRYQQELEAEIRAIGKEQSVLVANLTQQLKLFQHRTATERRIELADDLANGYVAWVLSNHCEVNGAAGMCQPPHKVSERLSEWQLYQKYRLESIPLLPSIEDGSAAPDEGAKRAEKRLRTRPVLQTSLLKPATERTATPESVIVKPKAADSLTPPVTPPSPTQSVQRSPSSSVSMAVKTVPATPAGGGSNKRKANGESSAMVESKTLRSRSTTNAVQGGPAKGGKTVEPVEDTEPGDTFEDSSASPVATVDVTAAVKRSRSSLYQALNKAKMTQKTSPPNSATKSNRGMTTVAANTTAGGANGNGRGSEAAARATSVSSDSSNSRSSTPGSSRKAVAAEPPVTSDDSSNDRFMPPEDYCPPPDTIHEWEQYTFLKLYGLYTLEDSRLLKERKNERKRRSCCSTERKDFHYGRYDQFEQQYYVLSKRRNNGNKRPALLYTATTVAERCMSHRKQQQQQRTGGGSWSTEPSPPLTSSPEDAAAVVPPTSRSESPASEPQLPDTAVLEPDNKMCFVCNEPGTSDSLSACVECCNIYHINCHTGEEEEPLAKTLPAPPAALETPAENNTAAAEGVTSTVAADTSVTESSSAIDDNVVQILQRDNLCPGCFKIAARKAQLRVA